MIVPQRQAAKKATESLHSANANVSAKEKKEDKETKGVGKENVVLSQQQSKSSAEVTNPTALDETRSSDKPKVEAKNDKKQEKDSKKTAAASTTTEKAATAAASDFPSYVPQRQAARKAAETIKIGSCKSSMSLFDIDSELSGDSSNKKKLKTVADQSKVLPVGSSAAPTKGNSKESKTKSKIEKLFESTDSDSGGDAKEDAVVVEFSKKKGKMGADAETTQATGKPFRDRGPRPSESESHSARGGVASSGQSSSAGRGAQKTSGSSSSSSKNASTAKLPSATLSETKTGSGGRSQAESVAAAAAAAAGESAA